jgi:hypothetical protein
MRTTRCSRRGERRSASRTSRTSAVEASRSACAGSRAAGPTSRSLRSSTRPRICAGPRTAGCSRSRCSSRVRGRRSCRCRDVRRARRGPSPRRSSKSCAGARTEPVSSSPERGTCSSCRRTEGRRCGSRRSRPRPITAARSHGSRTAGGSCAAPTVARTVTWSRSTPISGRSPATAANGCRGSPIASGPTRASRYPPTEPACVGSASTTSGSATRCGRCTSPRSQRSARVRCRRPRAASARRSSGAFVRRASRRIASYFSMTTRVEPRSERSSSERSPRCSAGSPTTWGDDPRASVRERRVRAGTRRADLLHARLVRAAGRPLRAARGRAWPDKTHRPQRRAARTAFARPRRGVLRRRPRR